MVALGLPLQPAPALAASGCGGFINPQRSHATNRAEAAKPPTMLRAGTPLGPIRYVPRGETAPRTLEEYLQAYCVTGLLVLYRGEVVFERYQQGVRPADHLLSASMSKSILALLVGIAVGEGRLRLDETVRSVFPDFEGSAFADATVEDLLRMTSGVALKNSYERGVVADNQATNPMISPAQNVKRYLRDKREFNPAGKVFDYNGAVSAMLGAVLRERTGATHTEYLAEKVWRPIGAEAPGYWVKNHHGEEGVQGQFAATLRDYGRLGLLVMNGGKVGEAAVVPASWVSEMVRARPDKPQPNRPPSYGLHVWIPEAASGRSMFVGTNGQAMFIDPVAQVVIVHTANSLRALYDGNTHLYPLRDAIVRALVSRSN